MRIAKNTFSNEVSDSMRMILIIVLFFLMSCSGILKNYINDKKGVTFSETEILEQLDLAFYEIPSKYYPSGRPEDIKYNFFLDLENGYCEVAGSRIHLYADSERWAIVFEINGYHNRASSALIELIYIGNCIDYPVNEYPERNYISNSSRLVLIEPAEFERIENKEGSGLETFELIGKEIKEIKIRDTFIPFDSDYKNYEKVGIELREYENPRKLIGFGDLIRYLHETNPDLIRATEDEIHKYIPREIPKLMTIDEFHFVSFYEKKNPPSQQETYKMIAKVLTKRDITYWKPTEKSNNSWKNWKSGNL